MTSVTFWAGKHLTQAEEDRLRAFVRLYEEAGCSDDAAWLRRFLPENVAGWTPDELESGAHLGPWLSVDARVEQ